MKKRSGTFYLLLVPVLLWLVMLIVVPHLDMFFRSFRFETDEGAMIFSLNNYLAFFEDQIYWLTFVKTALYSIGVTFLAFVVTFPVAFYLTKVIAKKYSSFMVLLLLIPIWIGELVTIYGWMILLSDNGVINNFLINIGLIDTYLPMLYNNFSMTIGLLYMSMLFMIVPMMSALESLDDSLIEAASDLGASKWTIFYRIVIPYTTPGIASGGIIVFMLVIGDYVAPNILGGKSSLWFTEQIYNKFLATFNWNEGAAFGFLLLMLSSTIIWIALKLTGQKLEKVGS
ncbi:spermidine/putrescine ABC transporter permease [Desulfomarina profundi]|uniref:Spermidine/putrescine ABC transporter permease n=1 Tax=Desulfomarina profundi TaxID=2772557 RepID=A0A8D5FGR9_9BACT|nr:ABC transporter permease [Desulfomarina profundi]BCL60325.1 spermidine/putrescine ABC transporter permease [Desulfomarina profundi]